MFLSYMKILSLLMFSFFTISCGGGPYATLLIGIANVIINYFGFLADEVIALLLFLIGGSVIYYSTFFAYAFVKGIFKKVE